MANRKELQNKGPGSRRGEHGQSIGPGISHRGISQDIKGNKRAEAIARNSKTLHDRTKAHRLSRCNKQACTLPE